MSVYEFVVNYFSRGIASACVPLFFLISGYLFFRETYSKKVYYYKLKRRINSLLLPYIIYNALALVIFAVFQLVMPQLISESKKPIIEYSMFDFVMAFWNNLGSGIPIDGPLWFIRNLMVVVIISPIIYIWVRFLKIIGIIILGTIWYCNICTYSIPGTLAIFFFSLGSYFALNKIDFGKLFCSRLQWCVYVYPLVVIIDSLTKNYDFTIYLHNVTIALGVIAWTAIAYTIQIKKSILWSRHLISATFFIYAFHEPYMDQLNKVLALILPMSNNYIVLQAQGILLYFIVTILYIVALIILFSIIKCLFPKIALLLSGGR